MTNIIIAPAINNVRFMYQKANTKAQKGLLGYMVKCGITADPILGGAFNLLSEVEKCNNRIYILNIACDPDVATEIGNVAERAKIGMYNKYAFSNRELARIMAQIKA